MAKIADEDFFQERGKRSSGRVAGGGGGGVVGGGGRSGGEVERGGGRGRPGPDRLESGLFSVRSDAGKRKIRNRPSQLLHENNCSRFL